MIADYLEASLEETITHVHHAAVRAAHEAAFYHASAPAALLPRVPGDEQFLIDEEFPPQADDTSARRRSRR